LQRKLQVGLYSTTVGKQRRCINSMINIDGKKNKFGNVKSF
jgi:hypothetical protein